MRELANKFSLLTVAFQHSGFDVLSCSSSSYGDFIDLSGDTSSYFVNCRRCSLSGKQGNGIEILNCHIINGSLQVRTYILVILCFLR